MVITTLIQLLALVDKGVDIKNWDTFEQNAKQNMFLDFLQKNHNSLVENGISTPLEYDDANKAFRAISNDFSSFEDMRRQYSIDNNNLLLIAAALISYSS